jgi:hypothetical protein
MTERRLRLPHTDISPQPKRLVKAIKKITPKEPQAEASKATADKTAERKSACVTAGHRKVGRKTSAAKSGH